MTAIDKNKIHPYTLSILLLGIFPGGFSLFYFINRSIISLEIILGSIILLGSLSIVLHFIIFKKGERYLGEVIFYSLGGWGIILTTFLMAINFYFHHTPIVKEYAIINREAEGTNQFSIPYYGSINNEKYRGYSYLLNFEEDEITNISNNPRARITEATGCLGFDIILNKELH